MNHKEISGFFEANCRECWMFFFNVQWDCEYYCHMLLLCYRAHPVQTEATSEINGTTHTLWIKSSLGQDWVLFFLISNVSFLCWNLFWIQQSHYKYIWWPLARSDDALMNICMWNLRLVHSRTHTKKNEFRTTNRSHAAQTHTLARFAYGKECVRHIIEIAKKNDQKQRAKPVTNSDAVKVELVLKRDTAKIQDYPAIFNSNHFLSAFCANVNIFTKKIREEETSAFGSGGSSKTNTQPNFSLFWQSILAGRQWTSSWNLHMRQKWPTATYTQHTALLPLLCTAFACASAKANRMNIKTMMRQSWYVFGP